MVLTRVQLGGKIKSVETLLCNNIDDVKKCHENFVKDGYEGTILRNASGMYISKRSHDLLKYKDNKI